ncbi:CLUMA_CG000965, isoform A [Clunio marinus]|uniref:CLUMA_CG000965, isoform A n=1 Tax=Clunio marinus TaxID=568069 RepID=A0A1J1HIC3_9DIPT|nr:CLUMA_CG000965, isoform A [Clunio marinus]
MPVGRVAGGNYYGGHLTNTGQSYAGINENIMYISIGMAIIIAILITIALIYIAYEKCQKRRARKAYYVTA